VKDVEKHTTHSNMDFWIPVFVVTWAYLT